MWKDVKKEFEINENGHEVLKKVTKESTFSFLGIEKEKWEFAFRGAGIIVIAFSIFGLWISTENQQRQNRFQIEQQRTLFELEVYKKTVKSLSLIVDGNAPAIERDEFINDVIPTIQILKNDSLSAKVDSFKELYLNYLYLRGITDSILQFYNVTKILSSLAQKNTDDSVTVRDLTIKYDILCMLIDKNYVILKRERSKIVSNFTASSIDQAEKVYSKISDLLLIADTHFNNIILEKRSTYNYKFLAKLHADYINFVNCSDYYNLRLHLEVVEIKTMNKLNILRTDITQIMQGSNKLLNQTY